MNQRLPWLALVALVLAAPASAGPSPRQVLAQADLARGKVPGLVWTVKMATSEAAEDREQFLVIKARNEDVLATFTTPLRLKGQRILMLGRNMWFIKPGVSKPVPLSPRQKLMGQAANGDIASTNYAGDYEGVFTGEETVAGQLCYVLDLAAKTKNVTYDRIVYWVSKGKMVGLKADFYTVSGKRFKSATFEYANALTHQGSTVPFVSKMVIQDALRPSDVTTLEYSAITVQELPDATFNLNLLVR